MARENCDWTTKSDSIMDAEEAKRRENLKWIWRLIQERKDDYDTEKIVAETKEIYKNMSKNIVENQNK